MTSTRAEGMVSQISSGLHARNNDRGVLAITSVPMDATVGNFTWSPVNVAAGWYKIMAISTANAFVQESIPFYIATGDDTSCIRILDGAISAFPTGSMPISSQTSTSRSSGTTGVELHVELASKTKSAGHSAAIAAVVVLVVVLLCGALVLIVNPTSLHASQSVRHSQQLSRELIRVHPSNLAAIFLGDNYWDQRPRQSLQIRNSRATLLRVRVPSLVKTAKFFENQFLRLDNV
ncbi:hypothetical protein R3P38DRAFT_3231206 [Favolaschia claudopus]|uniref:Uncharacterized protein n=1 Tax=Favolaschia claudopus TaxID=2862362 RepID=A0AAV9ZKW2_9AGAR